MIQTLGTLVQKRFQSSIESLESVQTPFSYYILTFIAIVVLRDLLEDFSAHATPDVFAIFIHFLFFYAALAATLTIALHVLTTVAITKVVRVVMMSFALILLAPILDMLIGGFGTFAPTYLSGDTSLIADYLTYFGPELLSGVTPGMRIEIGCALLLSFGYILLKTKNLWTGVVGILVTYTIIFTYIAMPALLTRLGIYSDTTAFYLPKFYFLALVGQVLYMPYRLYPKTVTTILCDLRPLRLFHYQFCLYSEPVWQSIMDIPNSLLLTFQH